MLKKSVSQPTQNALKCIEMQRKFLTNIFTKFDQNMTHSKRDISRKSETDRHTHTHTQRDKVCKSLQSRDCDDNLYLMLPDNLVLHFLQTHLNINTFKITAFHFHLQCRIFIIQRLKTSSVGFDQLIHSLKVIYQ